MKYLKLKWFVALNNYQNWVESVWKFESEKFPVEDNLAGCVCRFSVGQLDILLRTRTRSDTFRTLTLKDSLLRAWTLKNMFRTWTDNRLWARALKDSFFRTRTRSSGFLQDRTWTDSHFRTWTDILFRARTRTDTFGWLGSTQE